MFKTAYFIVAITVFWSLPSAGADVLADFRAKTSFQDGYFEPSENSDPMCPSGCFIARAEPPGTVAVDINGTPFMTRLGLTIREIPNACERPDSFVTIVDKTIMMEDLKRCPSYNRLMHLIRVEADGSLHYGTAYTSGGRRRSVVCSLRKVANPPAPCGEAKVSARFEQTPRG